MALDVKIVIDIAKAIGNVGFGCPLILEENASAEKAYTEVRSLSEVVTAGYAATTDVYKAAQLMFGQEHYPDKIALCSTDDPAETWLGVDSNTSKEWRQLVVINGSSSEDTTTNVNGIMAKIESLSYPKIYFANVAMTDSTSFNKTDVERTVLCFYTPTEDIPSPVAAIAGEVGGLEVGSYTLNNLKVKGVPALELSDTQIAEIHTKGGVTLVLSAGDCVVSEGKSAGGSFIDNVDGNDFIRQQLEYKTQKVFNDNLKVPYTNAGIAMLESAAISVMADAQNKGIVESYTVTYALRENTKAEDRAARKYFGGNITYSMAGAIHEATIYCVCSL